VLLDKENTAEQICHYVYIQQHISAILIFHMNFINNASGMKVAWLQVNYKMWFKLILDSILGVRT
jgi:hypothetical protein